MYIVALAWIYVVLMMSITETSVVAGVMTFLMYGVVPVTIILYVMGTPGRRRRRILAEKQRREAEAHEASEAAQDANAAVGSSQDAESTGARPPQS